MDGIASNFNGTSSHGYLQCGITRSGSTATVTTYTRHGLSVGDRVQINGCTQTEYNGWFVIASVPTTSSFTYVVEGTPATPATGLPTAVPGLKANRAFPPAVDPRSGRLQVNDALPCPNPRVTATATLNVTTVVALSTWITPHAETQFIRLSVHGNNIRYTIHGDDPGTASAHQIVSGTTIDLHPAFFSAMRVRSETGTANLYASELVVL